MQAWPLLSLDSEYHKTVGKGTVVQVPSQREIPQLEEGRQDPCLLMSMITWCQEQRKDELPFPKQQGGDEGFSYQPLSGSSDAWAHTSGSVRDRRSTGQPVV